MICADTSSIIYYLARRSTPETELVHAALMSRRLHLPPPVVTELLSYPSEQEFIEPFLDEAPFAPIDEGMWARAGKSRALLLSKGHKAKLADTLIAQCCIDADATLIASDGDFRHFAKWCGLKLAE